MLLVNLIIIATALVLVQFLTKPVPLRPWRTRMAFSSAKATSFPAPQVIVLCVMIGCALIILIKAQGLLSSPVAPSENTRRSLEDEVIAAAADLEKSRRSARVLGPEIFDEEHTIEMTGAGDFLVDGKPVENLAVEVRRIRDGAANKKVLVRLSVGAGVKGEKVIQTMQELIKGGLPHLKVTSLSGN
ncbi:MAG: hypothetical protein JNG86_08290 [Verrucomicrobiaceae bacterium]|nr:hypothetical protein [Verrucomicrobiaceae bacterium]